MKKFKEQWEIEHNWQLLFPVIGLIALAYSAFKIAYALAPSINFYLQLLIAIFVFTVLLFTTLWLFKLLEKRWKLNYKWEMIRVFIVFALTGTSAMYVSRPFFKLIGITKENLNTALYWVLFIIFGLLIYQLLLLTFGWLFGQFNFFWEFEKKMLKRFGLKKFLNEN